MHYGNRGMTFESLIEYANCQYRAAGTAIIEKQHTHFVPIRNGAGQIITCKVEEKATVDFMGRFGHTPIAFEAKHSSEDKIALKRVEPHQCEFLKNWTKREAAIGFVLVSFRFEEFYLIPWSYWQAAIKARETKIPVCVRREPMRTEWQVTGKASIRTAGGMAGVGGQHRV